MVLSAERSDQATGRRNLSLVIALGARAHRRRRSCAPTPRTCLKDGSNKPACRRTSLQNRKIVSDCSFHASQPRENCSFSDRAGTRTKLSLISFLLLPRLFFFPPPIQLGLYGSVFLGQVEELPMSPSRLILSKIDV